MMPYRQVCKVIDSTLQTIITKDCVLKAVKFVEKLLKEKERYRFYLEEPLTLSQVFRVTNVEF